jgi:hypothetical protein
MSASTGATIRKLDQPVSLTPTLGSVEALFRKLERESYRAFHSRNAIHKADHFLNFCITAHSLRDYYFERMNLVTSAEQQPFHEAWSSQPLLVAVADIANSAKHFVLREFRTKAIRKPRTGPVRLRKGSVMEFYLDAVGQLQTVQAGIPDVRVTLSDGTRHELFSFMAGVLHYWTSYLRANGIRLRRQTFSTLSAYLDR